MNIFENGFINIINSNQNNLKNVSLKIPKKRVTIITGISGSGKSSLAIDTIAAESRRELNDTFDSFVRQYLPKYGRPDVEKIDNLPIAILLDQKKPSKNSRSTIGTYTDIYSYLRLLFSRAGIPFVGYSEIFSFNHPLGMCPKCKGLGYIKTLNIHKLVDFDKCLNDDGVISFPAFTTGAWRWKRYAYSGLFDLNKKIKDYTKEELDLFLYSPQIKLKNPPSNWPKSAKFEGIYPRMYRSIINSKEGERHSKLLSTMVTTKICDECNGSRLNKKILSCKINGKNISDVINMSIPEAKLFISCIESDICIDIKNELINRLNALIEIGLGYLTLSRGMSTLSGGEAQRIKVAKYINSALADIIYILDEPSVGLHPHDINLLTKSIIKLKNRGNTILIIEHHKEIIKLADYIVDMGPGAGVNGGNVVFTGTYKQLLNSNSITGISLSRKIKFKENTRMPLCWNEINNANKNNLKGFSTKLPFGVLTVIAGVAGSGKTSLMNFFKETCDKEVVYVNQRDIGINSRSTPATYLNISDSIRELFANANGISSSYFSFNSKGGCKVCGGKGYITSDLSFMDSVQTRCEACKGKKYSNEVLQYKYLGLNIADTMDLTVSQAIDLFKNEIFINKLESLQKVGLGYLKLNQSLSTLSGGELQRIKLASYLSNKQSIFILDEPTDGLHPKDISKLINVFNDMVDAGNSLFVITHSIEMIKSADYIIELGPKGGYEGGNILYEGIPINICNSSTSITKDYLY